MLRLLLSNRSADLLHIWIWCSFLLFNMKRTFNHLIITSVMSLFTTLPYVCSALGLIDSLAPVSWCRLKPHWFVITSFRVVHTMRVRRRMRFGVIGVNEWLMHFLRLNCIQCTGWTSSIANRSLWKRHKKRENLKLINNSAKESETHPVFLLVSEVCEKGRIAENEVEIASFKAIIRLTK